MTTALIEKVAKIRSAPQASAAYPWGLMSIRSDSTATIHGWYKREQDAKNVALHVLHLSHPIIARHYTRSGLSRTRGVLHG